MSVSQSSILYRENKKINGLTVIGPRISRLNTVKPSSIDYFNDLPTKPEITRQDRDKIRKETTDETSTNETVSS